MDTNKMFIDMARQAREFAEMCNRVANESNAVKEDPEAWRERNRQRQAAGVKFEWRNEGIWRRGYKGSIFTFDIGGEEDYREVQEAAEDAVEIRKWADRYYSLWCFVENSLPRDASSDTFDIFRGYARQVNDEIYGVTDKAKEPHAAERALWKAQREAGTNEVWQWKYFDGTWVDIIDLEPRWTEKEEYRVKPMKLTAVIVRKGRTWDDGLQNWEFTGTREEYRAECEKYGYVVISEIKEVKLNTVTYYFALFKTPWGRAGAESHKDKQRLRDWIKKCGYTIIGNIEEREIEA